MGSFVIDLIIGLVTFVFQLVVDLLCLAAFLAGMAGVWRLPFNVAIMTKSGCGRNQVRMGSMLILGCTLCDILTFPMFVIVHATWRLPHMYSEMESPCKHGMDNYAGECRLIAAKHFFLFFIDIPFVVMGLVTTLMPWRSYKFWKRMIEHSKSKGWLDTGFRSLVASECAKSMIDVLTIPMAIVVGVTWYRVPLIKAEWDAIDTSTKYGTPTTDSEKLFEKKKAFGFHFFNVLFDIPFVVLFVVVVLTGWRARALVSAVQTETDAGPRRIAILLHFGHTLLDYVVFLPMFLCIVATMYRLLPLLQDLYSAVQPAADVKPQLILTAAVPRYLPRGVEIRCVGTKTVGFSLKSRKVYMFVRNENLWEHVGGALGGAAAFGGRAFLPLSMTPTYLDPLCLESDRSDFELTVRFDVNVAQATIESTIAKMAGRHGNPSLMLQLEYGAHEGTLFNMSFTFQELQNCLSATDGASLPLADVLPISVPTEGQWMCDVLPEKLLPKFLYLCLDMYGVLCFVLLHLVPHRCYAMYSTAFTGVAQERSRRSIAALSAARMSLKRRTAAMTAAMDHADSELLIYERTYHGYYGPVVRPHVGLKTYAFELESAARTLSENQAPEAAAALEEVLSKDHDTLQFHANILGAQMALTYPEGGRTSEAQFNHITWEGRHDAVPAVVHIQDDTAVAADYRTLAEYVDAGDRFAKNTRLLIDSMLTHKQEDLHAAGFGGGTEGWAQVRSVVIWESAEFAYDVTAMVAFCVTLCTVYRTYTLLDTVFENGANKRRMCIWNFWQIFVDMTYVLKLALIIGSVRHAFSCVQDIVVFTSGNPGFKSARTVIDHYLRSVVSDILTMLSFLFAWKAMKYIVSAAVFGFFSPGILLDSTLASEPSKCRAVCVLLVCCGWLYGFPFIMVYGMMPSAYGAALTIFYLSLAMFFLAALLQGFRQIKPPPKSAPKPKSHGLLGSEAKSHWDNKDGRCRTPGCNWYGSPDYCSECAKYRAKTTIADTPDADPIPSSDCLSERQTSLNGGGHPEPESDSRLSVDPSPELFMSDGFTTIRAIHARYLSLNAYNVAHYILLFYEMALLWSLALMAAFPANTYASKAAGYILIRYDAGMYVAVALALALYLLASMPVVVHDVLQWSNNDNDNDVTQWFGWHAGLHVLRMSLATLIVYHLAGYLACADVNGTLSMLSDPATPCFVGAHAKGAICVLLLLVFYVPCSLMISSRYHEVSFLVLEVQYSQCYVLIINGFTILAVVLNAHHPHDVSLCCGTLAALAVIAVPLTLGNATWYNACSVQSVAAWRAIGYGVLLVFAVIGIAGPGDNADSIVVAVLGAAACVGAVRSIAFRCQKSILDDDVHSLQNALLALEQSAYDHGATFHRWGKLRGAWRRHVASTLQICGLADALLRLDGYVSLRSRKCLFLRGRTTWNATVKSLRYPLRPTADFDRYLMSWGASMWEVYCDCMCHDDYGFYAPDGGGGGGGNP